MARRTLWTAGGCSGSELLAEWCLDDPDSECVWHGETSEHWECSLRGSLSAGVQRETDSQGSSSGNPRWAVGRQSCRAQRDHARKPLVGREVLG